MNIKSQNIKIYPTANRTLTNDYGANISLEQNITGLSNNIVDYDSYAVSGSLDIAVESSKIKINSCKCVLKGYSISIDAFDTQYPTSPATLNPSDMYYLYLYLDGPYLDPDNNNVKRLLATDNLEMEYEGVKLIIQDTEYTGSYDLYLGYMYYNQDTAQWEFKNNEFIYRKFDGNNIQIELEAADGLTKNQIFSGNLSDWLQDNFILDDGDIS